MDWADDITYAVHDLEDFIRAGHVPMVTLATIDDGVEKSSPSRAIKRLKSKEKFADINWDEVLDNFEIVVKAFFEQFKRHNGTCG